ncbi:iron oxidase [Bradyrhizobium jicamae]|uniref:iron oxidase n=1 Tax=Bradyrhizobium jicamae TaxID=280332 RepID=UPI001BA65451|nr:iron oxidase [Bradyrhizobium jicamae]MBR0757254.1 iron oxidase [Bradyrhizobium jicamae]
MTGQSWRCSRRRLIALAAVMLSPNPTSASDKMTKPQAAYQDGPNGIYSCGLCTLFVEPNGCKVVEGEISKGGWCKAFAPVD